MSAEPHTSLEILTPEGPWLELDGIRWVRAELRDGLIGILPGHAPLLAELAQGSLTYADDSGEHDLPVAGGVFWVHAGGIRILTDRGTEEAPQRSDSDLAQRLEKLEEPVSDLLSSELGTADNAGGEGSEWP